MIVLLKKSATLSNLLSFITYPKTWPQVALCKVSKTLCVGSPFRYTQNHVGPSIATGNELTIRQGIQIIYPVSYKDYFFLFNID